jgi:protein ImuB
MRVRANLGIAANPTAAMLAAQNIPGVTILAPGREPEILAPLSIAALPAPADLLATLSRWGVRTLGELAALPEIGLVERFGAAGSELRKLALGQGESFLGIRPPAAEYVTHQRLDDPITLLEPLLFLVAKQLHELTERLRRNGRATNRITLDLTLETGAWQRVLALPLPMREAWELLRQVRLSLEAHPPEAAILGLGVTLDAVEPRVLQNGLFVPAAPEPEKFQGMLAKLHALVGSGRAGTPEVLNTHRPDAYRLRPSALEASFPEAARTLGVRLAFRYFRPPLRARVALQGNRIQRVTSDRIAGDVVLAAGPWRSSGDWWAAETAWEREEWDIVLESQAAYRIYRSRGDWFLEGNYD